MAIYTTIQGDTWDTAARAVYDDEKQAQTLLQQSRNELTTKYSLPV